MRFKFECIKEQLCQMYFSLSVDEVEKLFVEAKDYCNNKECEKEIVEYIKDKIDNEILEEKFDEYDVITIGPRMTNFMSDITRGKPIMGISKCCLLPEDVSISLPTEIPEIMYNFNIEDSTIESLANGLLISNNFYTEQNIDFVDEDCYVTYDLCYMKDDLVLNEIKNQATEMKFDLILSEKFRNKKVGSKVILDKDDVDTIAIIKKIEKRIPYELTDEVVCKLRFGSIKTKKGLFEKLKKILEFQKNIQTANFFIIESLLNSNQFEFDDCVIKFFFEGLPKIKDEDVEEMTNNIKRMLITEILIKIIELKTDNEDLSPDLYRKLDDLSKLVFIADGRKSKSLLREMFDDQIRQLKILKFCRDTGMVANIKL